MPAKKLSTAAIIMIAVAALSLTLTTAALLSASQTIPLSGAITAVNVGVYSDSGCTQNCTSLNVGSLSPSDTVTQTVYVKNAGNVPVTLSMAANNWSPTGADSYLSLSWNRESYVLNADQSVQATLTLTVASDTGSLTTFSCDVTITGTQQ